MDDPDWLHPSITAGTDEANPEPARPPDRDGLRIRAIRGAITVEADEPTLIAEATRALLTELLHRNAVHDAQLVSALFTLTPDLTSEFPARAARELGWADVPILCAQEIAVPGALARCLRVLVHVESSLTRAAVQHVYLRGAVVLRPDLNGGAVAADRAE